MADPRSPQQEPWGMEEWVVRRREMLKRETQKVKMLGEQYERLQQTLSLIHISEPTRPEP